MTAVDLAAASIEAYNTAGPSGLVDRYDEFFSLDLRWHPVVAASVGEREVFEGRDGLGDWAQTLSEAFDDLRLEPAGIVPVGDGVLMLGTLVGMGRASGVPTELEFGMFFRAREGRFYWGRSWASHADALAGTAEILRGESAQA